MMNRTHFHRLAAFALAVALLFASFGQYVFADAIPFPDGEAVMRNHSEDNTHEGPEDNDSQETTQDADHVENLPNPAPADAPVPEETPETAASAQGQTEPVTEGTLMASPPDASPEKQVVSDCQDSEIADMPAMGVCTPSEYPIGADGTAGDDYSEPNGEDIEIPVSGTSQLTLSAAPSLLLTADDDGIVDDSTASADDDEEIDEDNIVLEGPAVMTRGDKLTYPTALGNWSTFSYSVDGKIAYCLESAKNAPKGGSFAQEILENNPDLAKVLYYGYGGPGDISAEFYPSFSENARYILTHIAASYYFTGDYAQATNGCSSTGLAKCKINDWFAFLTEQEDPPSPAIALSSRTLTVTDVSGGVQTTSSTTLQADHRNSITLSLPANVTYHNENTGATQTGGEVAIHGGTTFHFTAPSSVTGSWESGSMKGSIGEVWKALIVKTGTKTQKLGSYASEEYGGTVRFSVAWKSQVTLNIVKADAANTDVHLAGAVIGVYSDSACTNCLATLTTGADGSASCTLSRDWTQLYLKELTAPACYRLNRTVYAADMPDGDSLSVMIKDEQQSAGLKITKRGEVLTGADVTNSGVRFVYEVRALSGAVFRVTAESAVYAPDGSLLYQKGDIIADGLTTGASGEVQFGNLPLGTYAVEETQAPAGFLLSSEKHTVTLAYAGQEAEAAFGETAFTNQRQKASLTISKQDGETRKPLAGGEFALYALSAITNYRGDALVSAGTLIETVRTGTDGNASFTADLPLMFSYEVREITPPSGYVFSGETFSFSCDEPAQTPETLAFSHVFLNDRITAALTMRKTDDKTGAVAQGDALLSGAVYALYARDAIVHPDGSTGTLYEKDALVTTMTTDENGEAYTGNLPLGRYYLKEITPSPGYLLDITEYEVDCTASDPTQAVVLAEVTVQETVIRQPFQIIKVAGNGKTDADLIEGAGFSAWLLSDLGGVVQGSDAVSSAQPVILGPSGETEIFTDSTGHATSVPLPFGTYLVRETTTPRNYAPVDDFIVTIRENHPATPQVWRVLLDEEFAAKLRIRKVDSATGRTTLLPGAEFTIYDLDRGTWVEQVTTYPQPVKHSTFTTDASGTLTLPEPLGPGHYRITEIAAPQGYLLGNASVDVTISDQAPYLLDTVSGDVIVETTLENAPVRGRITVYKEGETLSRFADGQFVYEVSRLPGAVFEIIAAEDIFTADHQIGADGDRYLEYAEGTVIATLTTDENGAARTGSLPLGAYKVVEKDAPEGFVRNAVPTLVRLEYAGQETEVVTEAVTLANARQKVSLIVLKKEKDTDTLLPGATLGLYAGEDICVRGSVIVPAGTCLATAVSDETGSVVFDLDLPLGKYLVNELQAPTGYILSEEVLQIEAGYQGQDVDVVHVSGTYKNKPTRVIISKADATTSVELDGAQLTLLDADGREIDSWTSVAGEPPLIEGLAIGATYSLREEIAPYGYLLSDTVQFTVGDTADVQKVVMKDEVPTGTIIINKSGEFLSSVSAACSALGWIGNTFSYMTGSLPDVTFGVYACEDIRHADGVSLDHYAAGTQIGTMTTDATGIARMENLPLGRYIVREIATRNGYVLDDRDRLIDLTYRDSQTPVVTYSEEWQNERQKALVTVVKKEKDGDRALEGAVFGLYSAEDIFGAGGKVILAKDTLIEQRATDSHGKLTFSVDLPVGFEYAIREIAPPAGYASDPAAQVFRFDGVDADTAIVEMAFSFENAPTQVEVKKTSLTTSEELEGASLQVADSDGKVIDSWVSVKEPHRITGLVVGKTYILTETLPAAGYATAESIAFTIADTGDVQAVEMKDDVTKVHISKTDISGKNELEGAALVLLDSEGNTVDSWISTSEPHIMEMLPIGEYTLREITAPEGYLVAEDVQFTVEDMGEVQQVFMKDAAEAPETPRTGDSRNPLLWGGVATVGLLCLMTALLIIRKNRRRF